MTELLSKEHTILERPFMEFRPFGVDESGEKIRDVAGISVRAMADYTGRYVSRLRGAQAGSQAIEELCRRLNERVRDPVYHVTPKFLRNQWNSYSYEFVCYVYEFCIQISGDPQFIFYAGKEKMSPTMQILGRPFSVAQIYRMLTHFGRKYAPISIVYDVVNVAEQSAVLRIKFADHVYEQFGPYRKRCAYLVCQSHHGSLAAVPELIHHLPAASVRDRTCIANGDEWCEWELRWNEPDRRRWFSSLLTTIGITSEPIESTRASILSPTTPPAERPPRAVETAGLPKERTILEQPFMRFRPFGVDENGTKIRDISGMIVKANVDQLEEYLTWTKGQEAGKRAVEDVCRLLNDRISDQAYHVTPEFLKRVWNSYSYEFVCYLREFCQELSGDADFHYHVGQGRHLSPMIQILGRPFNMSQIYRLWPHFAQKFAKGSVICEVGPVTHQSAILRLQFTERSYEQFGPYRRACARLTCEASKGGLSMVPARVHNLAPATVKDRTCIAKGDPWCEWEVTWTPAPYSQVRLPVIGLLAGASVFGYLRFAHPTITVWQALAVAVVPALVTWVTTSRRLHKHAQSREALIQEQVQFLESRHEELREAYLEQEQTRVELRRKVKQLTALHQAGLLFGSTLDRESLRQNVLEALTNDLQYDRAMLSFFDPERQVVHDSRILGVSKEIEEFVRSHEFPVTNPATPEGTVLLHGKSLLINDIQEVWGRLHPRNQQLATMTNAKSVIIAPLRVKDRILGSLTVDRMQEHSLTRDDLDLIVTVANQVAIALDNMEAYRQIESLNVSLEAKVRERTAELERLNLELTTAYDQLRELDRLKSEFFANVSHEFRSPLTLTLGAFRALLKSSPPSSRELIQSGLRNTSRLLFLINEFLDLARFDSGMMELKKQCIDFAALVRAVASNFESADRRRVHFQGASAPVPIEADLGQMKKVLYNLLSNAFKFSDADKGEVWIRLATRGDCVEIEIEDNGIGIPRDQFHRIFERFAQVERRATRRYEGTGIGLALVKQMVSLHGGTITVESELGRGSTFIISLPRGGVSEETVTATDDGDAMLIPFGEATADEQSTPSDVVPPDDGSRPLVLIVDDNADMRGYLARILSNRYRVILAKDGLEGMEQARTFPPDLILTDLMMPRMSGNDLLKAVRSDRSLRATPVVFLTARAGTEARVESLEAGSDDYIAKPFDEHEIVARVNNLIRLRAQERELVALHKDKMTRFLPAQIADVIFSERADDVLKSHRAEISVVFIDLRGFTAFAETAEPEDVMAVLKEYQTEMGRLIADHHGVIERFSGDAIMIFFNDPVPILNHAEQAVRLAVAMRAEVVQLKRKWAQRGIDLGAGIGVATGYATLGLVGFEQRKDYAAIGAVTNLAARLCGEARHGQILISERVRHFVKDLVHAESVGTIALKGFQKPVMAYNVAGLAESRPVDEGTKKKKRTKR